MEKEETELFLFVFFVHKREETKKLEISLCKYSSGFHTVIIFRMLVRFYYQVLFLLLQLNCRISLLHCACVFKNAKMQSLSYYN